MVKGGYAVLFTIPPNIKYVDELRVSQNEARQHRREIFNSKGLKEIKKVRAITGKDTINKSERKSCLK